MFTKIKDYIRSKWEALMSWFKDSETIFLASLQGIAGFATAVVGALDWSPLLSIASFNTGLSRTQVITIGAIMLVKSAIDVVARMYREDTL